MDEDSRIVPLAIPLYGWHLENNGTFKYYSQYSRIIVGFVFRKHDYYRASHVLTVTGEVLPNSFDKLTVDKETPTHYAYNSGIPSP